MDKKTIEKNVKMENRVREIGNMEVKRIIPIMADFIGKKILKADGSLTKKVKDAIKKDQPEYTVEPLNNGDFASFQGCYVQPSVYSQWLKVTICFNGGKHEDRTYYCVYKDFSYCLGDTKDGILHAVAKGEERPIVDAEEEYKNHSRALELQEELRELDRKLLQIHSVL